MELTWKDRPGHRGAIAVQQSIGHPVRQQIVNGRSVDVFAPELLRQVMVDHADSLIRWERGPGVFSDGLGRSVLDEPCLGSPPRSKRRCACFPLWRR